MCNKLIITIGLIVVFTALGFGETSPRLGVLGSVHDMRIATNGATEAFDRVCAFCHTPHHAQTAVAPDNYYPLWSRQMNTNVFQPYASTTINSADYNADIAIGPTRLCMTCHDGSIAIDQHNGISGTGRILTETGFNSPGIGQGNNSLTNNHPVGMNYYDVAVGPSSGDPTSADIEGAAFNQDAWIRRIEADLMYKNNHLRVKVGDRLYVSPTDPTKAYMTCATCHDVHNKKNCDLASDPANYLLLAPQRDSDLCLTCHIK